jgi:enoyl-CoA hydratase
MTTVRREPIREGITLLTLDRPERLNAMSRELVHDLHEGLTAVEDDRECRVVILTGAGRGSAPASTSRKPATSRPTSAGGHRPGCAPSSRSRRS